MIRNLRELLRIGIPRDSGFKLGLLLTFLQGASAVALMGASAWLISRAAEHPPVMFLNMAVVLVRGFALGRAFFRYTERLTLHNSAFKMQTQLRQAIYSKIVPLAPAGLTQLNRASTVSNLVDDVNELQNLPLRVMAPVLQATLVSIATVGFLAFLQPQAALMLFVSLVIVAFGVAPLSAKFSRKAGADSAPARAQLATETSNFLEHLDVLMAYGWAENAGKRVTAVSNRVLETNRVQAVTSGFGTATLALLASTTTAAATYFGALDVLNGAQPRVMLAVISLLPIALFDVVANALPAVNAWQRYRSSANRVNQLLDNQPAAEIVVGPGSLPLEAVQSIELLDVTAHYPGESSPAIQGVSFRLNAGGTLQLKGASGAGKTTIALLLTRLLNASDGHYLVNGITAEGYDQSVLRSKIGYLEQSPTIFMGSLRDNLLIANPDATDTQLHDVIERVGLFHSFVGRAGLDTQLGERGFAISGGEAQRVALARALLANFQVLIFDEPTANVDEKLAASLWDDLLEIVSKDRSKAAIFITHESLPSERFSQVVTL